MKDRTNKIKQQIEPILKQFPITNAYLFGSVLRDDFNDDSDIDILFNYNREQGFTLLDMYEVQNLISDKLGRKIDLIPETTIKEHSKKEILSQRVLIYE